MESSGGPPGPIWFRLGLPTEMIQELLPGILINACYLDNGTLCGSAKDLSSALVFVEAEGPARGLHLNRLKSLLFISEGFSSSPNLSHLTSPSQGGGGGGGGRWFTLLAALISPPSYCESVVLDRVKKVQKVLAHLPDLQDSQMETTPPSFAHASPFLR